MTSDLIPDRREYGDRSLNADDLKSDPFEVFREWLSEAVEAGVPEANALCLSTLDSDGFPDSRILLLKGVEQAALRFYSNYESRKGQQLVASDKASMVFWWEPLKRQVRLVGRVERLPASESDQYFASRPRESRLGAWASLQSTEIADRSELEQRLQEMAERFPGDVPRPPHWGGYRLRPHRMEFWQGRTSRLHDRFVYQREGQQWSPPQRLMP